MRAWIENGGVDMPAFKDSLTAQQISDLIAFLRTL
jgi:mono/diheme cytochrome c family protein